MQGCIGAARKPNPACRVHGLPCGSEFEEVSDEVVPDGGHDRFGVELHAVQAEFLRVEGHDDAVLRPRANFERRRKRFALHDQRVVAGGREGVRDVAEHPLPVVIDLRGLAVHDLPGADDLAAKRFADGLMAEADAEQRDVALRGVDERNGDSGVGGRTRPRRDDDLLRLKRERLFDGQFIVPVHRHLGSEFADVLDKVVRKRVVIVYNKNHKST